MSDPLRVLFVDDEQRILDGLRRSLRDAGAHRFHFASNAELAQAILRSGPIDLVVSDMRMPGVDGADLLEEIARDHPSTVRVVLSGHTNPGELLRGVRAGHRYYTKPVDPSTLRRLLDEVQALLGDVGPDAGVIAAAQQFPVSPSAVARLRTALCAGRVSMADVNRGLRGAPGLVLGVMRLAYGGFLNQFPGPDLADVSSAVGAELLLLLLDGEVLHTAATPAQLPRIEAIERHARAALRVAGRLVGPARAGLAETATLASLAGPLLGVPQAAEASLGAGLGLLWGVPAVIVRAVADSARPSASLGAADLPGVIHVARAIAEEVVPLHHTPPPFEPPPQLWAQVAPVLHELQAAARSAIA